MTAPRPRTEHRFLRPIIFFPALLLLVVVSVLLTPHTRTDEGGYLTTHSTSPTGASGLMEVAQRFGWNTRRLQEPLSTSMSADAIYAVLVPGRSLTETETHVLLDRVRAGASLLVVLGGGALRDSLHIDAGDREGPLVHSGDRTCPKERMTMRTLQTRVPLLASDVERIAPLSGDTVHLAVMGSGRPRVYRPAILGLTLGRGRIAAVAESRMLTNEALRVCDWGAGISVVRTLEWLTRRDDGSPPLGEIVFDEFHHGYGNHASVVRTMQRWAAHTPSGRTTLQIAVAGVILLLAAGARPIPPVPVRTIARRSPLEHVTALAQAYERVRGTRIGTRLLVKGVRRRANRPVGAHTVTEEAFLEGVATRSPSLRADVSRVTSAMTREVPPAEFLDIASIIDRIERSVRS